MKLFTILQGIVYFAGIQVLYFFWNDYIEECE